MDWFKMRTIWGASIERFSDAEAGRFIKALFAFVRGGDEYVGCNGREDPIIWQALETLRADVTAYQQNEAVLKEKEAEKREKRRQAAMARWHMQADANASKCMQVHANESICMQVDANAWENNIKTEKEKDEVSHTEDKTTAAQGGARAREDGYIGLDGKEHPCRYDLGWKTSRKARCAVAQRIINGLPKSMDMEFSAPGLFEDMLEAMTMNIPPEVIEDLGKIQTNSLSFSQQLNHMSKENRNRRTMYIIDHVLKGAPDNAVNS